MDFIIEERDNCIVLEGDIDSKNVLTIDRSLRSIDIINNTIQMTDVEIEDGPALAEFITTLRALSPVTLIEPPQMLSHTIYKINAICEDNITLVRPRVGS
tara:strand:- start:271 stop:570 length:300 start_codon:yes stop_codon:yes gene_type:complete